MLAILQQFWHPVFCPACLATMGTPHKRNFEFAAHTGKGNLTFCLLILYTVKNVTILFYSRAPPPTSEKALLFWRVPRFARLAFWFSVTCRWIWVSSTGGMMLTGENRSTRRQPAPVSLLPLFGTTAPQWAKASSYTRFLDHIWRTAIGRTPLDDWSARHRDLYLTTHNTHNRQTSMPPAGFEPTISAGERPKTYA